MIFPLLDPCLRLKQLSVRTPLLLAFCWPRAEVEADTAISRMIQRKPSKMCTLLTSSSNWKLPHRSDFRSQNSQGSRQSISSFTKSRTSQNSQGSRQSISSFTKSRTYWHFAFPTLQSSKKKLQHCKSVNSPDIIGIFVSFFKESQTIIKTGQLSRKQEWSLGIRFCGCLCVSVWILST